MSTQPVEVKTGVFDWSTVNRPVGKELFNPQQDKKTWSDYRLSEEQVSQFWRDGFLTNIPVLTTQQCDLVLEDYKHLTGEKPKHPAHELLYEYHSNQSGDPDNVLMHCLGHWRMSKLFHDLIYHPKLIVPSSQLLCQDSVQSVRFWHDQAFAKPAKHGGVVAWHQDYSYWTRTKPCMHVTCHIALDDQTEENGTLLYIPGSHRWLRNGNPLPVLDFSFKDMEGIKTILTDEELTQFHPVSSLLKKGEASFHSSLTVHGSYGNRSDKPRRSAVLNYFADGVYSDSEGYMLVKPTAGGGEDNSMFSNSYIRKHSSLQSSKLLGTIRDSKRRTKSRDRKGGSTSWRRQGQKMEGQFFPLVFDKDWI